MRISDWSSDVCSSDLHNYRLGGATPWMQRYRWPVMFFIAVAFWNLVGAGLFGFLIHPPLSLYYMQGLKLTQLHGHTALFGVDRKSVEVGTGSAVRVATGGCDLIKKKNNTHASI